ncbi:hypothetical protein [Winogradskyella wichelsiae]|uniref:hypothetical protein n=1 Tax=Winogradskyella wichelsiae TaxID=2697007 RepID=UPI0015C863A2|nr:hypothetical protein [Winogradskyella wichelsiae]
MKITVKDYKDHIRKKLDNLLDSNSIKEMEFIKIEIIHLLDRINEKDISTEVIENQINELIEMFEKGYKTERLEPFNYLLIWIDNEFYNKI